MCVKRRKHQHHAKKINGGGKRYKGKIFYVRKIAKIKNYRKYYMEQKFEIECVIFEGSRVMTTQSVLTDNGTMFRKQYLKKRGRSPVVLTIIDPSKYLFHENKAENILTIKTNISTGKYFWFSKDDDVGLVQHMLNFVSTECDNFLEWSRRTGPGNKKKVRFAFGGCGRCADEHGDIEPL